MQNNNIEFVLPTVIPPRYSKLDTQLSQAEYPSYEKAVPYKLQIDVEVDLHSEISGVKCNSHNVKTEITGNKAKVSLAEKEVPMDTAFIFHVAQKDPYSMKYVDITLTF